MSKKFPGFPPEQQTWDFPNIVNGYVHFLSGAEFKVLWYILRHTYGWQKMQDAINLSQFERGIKRKSGDWLDKGTGLSRKTIIRALKSLEGKGFIQVRRTRGGRGLKSVNVYAPKLAVAKGNCLEYKNATANSGKRKPTIVNNTIPKDTKKDMLQKQSATRGFNFSSRLEEMEKDKNRHIQIIALYWRFKGLKAENYEQYQAFLKRELRPARQLVGFSNEQILKVMGWLQNENTFKWGLETVMKYIGEDLKQIKPIK